MHIIKGSILDSKDEILAHQVNCKGVMGAGLAKFIKAKYPRTFAEYKKQIRIVGPDNILGRCHVVKESDRYIANLFGQYAYSVGKSHTDYEALEMAFMSLRDFAESKALRTIAIPYNLGCGLAGGNWDVVSAIIDKIFNPILTDVTVTAYDINY
jgi:O-acetyl-ADP-ribose deacetylase (regulator of RNase III)